MEAPSAPAGRTSRWARMRAALTPQEWRRAAGLAAVVVGLHAVGFFLLLVLVVPRDLGLGQGTVFGVGLGITAYTLGLRHAFDADHIGAIDNTTRKLMADGQRPLGVGFFFSLGHSTVVFALALLFSLGIRGLSGSIESEGSALHTATGLIGPGVSGSFLFVIGILNLLVLVGIVRVLRDMRSGTYSEDELEELLRSRGLMNRLLGRLTNAVSKTWQMYPLGVLFGLGFDTASEVALLFLAAGAASTGVPFYAILALPVLFAAGMSLLDTLDGSFMNFAYGWALARPARKAFYNLVVTALSAGVALLVGGLELLGLVWDRAADIDLNAIGFAVVGLFALTFAAAWATWRLGHLEERWSRATTS